MRVVVLWVVDVPGRESAPGKGRVWQWCVKLGGGELVLPQDSGSCLPQGRCLYTLGDLRTPFENLIVDLFFQKHTSHNVYKRGRPSTPPRVDCLRAPTCSLVPGRGVRVASGRGGCTVRRPCLRERVSPFPFPPKEQEHWLAAVDSAREELA